MALQLLVARIAKATVAMMRMVVRIEATLTFLVMASIAGFGGNILIAIIKSNYHRKLILLH